MIFVADMKFSEKSVSEFTVSKSRSMQNMGEKVEKEEKEKNGGKGDLSSGMAWEKRHGW